MHRPYPHCPRCGARLPEGRDWPKRCGGCDRETYLSPAPVGVVLQPVGAGLVVVQRGIRPHKGAWALPGGFIDAHESWQEGCARELWEESGIRVAPDALTLHSVEAARADNMILFFALAPALDDEGALPPFVANHECTARRVMRAAEALAFPLHTQAAAQYLGG